jgi:hypothetical protein
MCGHTQSKVIFYFLAILGITFAPSAYGAVLAQQSHGHDCTTAGDISLNTDVAASLTDTSDYAVYRMVLPQRGVLDVWIDAGVFDMWGMDLLDSSCRPVPNVIGDESLLTRQWMEIAVPHKGMVTSDPSVWTLAPGLYFVRIRPNPVEVFEDRFTFHTKFIPHFGHDCETAEPLKLPGQIEGELLYADDREVFEVTTTQTGRIHVWTTGSLIPPKEPVIKLHVANCSTKAEFQMSGAGTGLMTPTLPPGTYYFSVEPWRPGDLGKYILHVELKTEIPAVTLAIPR